MHSILNFPEQFRVNKKLGKERYMNHGNLTPAERKRLEAYMGNVELLYAIPFSDGSEMIVISTDVETSTTKQSYFTSNYVKAIAQSFPYLCLIIMRFQSIVKFFIFDERVNHFDPNRFYSENTYATEEFTLTTYNYQLLDFTNKLRSAISEARSAKDLHNKWRALLIANARDIETAQLNAYLDSHTLNHYIHQYANEMKEYNLYESVLDGDYEEDYEEEFDPDDYEWDLIEQEERLRSNWGDEMYETERNLCHIQREDLGFSDIYSKRSLDTEDSIEESLFIDFCAAHCWLLYIEATKAYNPPASEREWFKDYFEACNAYAEEFFGRSVDSKITQKIRKSYDQRAIPDDDYYGNFDIQQLKAYLWRYFD